MGTCRSPERRHRLDRRDDGSDEGLEDANVRGEGLPSPSTDGHRRRRALRRPCTGSGCRTTSWAGILSGNYAGPAFR